MIFDPAEFMREHPDPMKKEFELDEAALRGWAIEGTSIRANF